MTRTLDHAEMVELARHSTVPVMNGVTERLHPLSDYFTIAEKKGRLKGLKLALRRTGRRHCHSLLFGANKVAMHIAIATPTGHEPKTLLMKSAMRESGSLGVEAGFGAVPAQAAKNADVVYTDTWTSGPESTPAATQQAFRGFQIDVELMQNAKPDALFMHRMPWLGGARKSAPRSSTVHRV